MPRPKLSSLGFRQSGDRYRNPCGRLASIWSDASLLRKAVGRLTLAIFATKAPI